MYSYMVAMEFLRCLASRCGAWRCWLSASFIATQRVLEPSVLYICVCKYIQEQGRKDNNSIASSILAGTRQTGLPLKNPTFLANPRQRRSILYLEMQPQPGPRWCLGASDLTES